MSTVTNIGGIPYYILEFGDELVYFTPYTITLFLLALIFTVLVIISRPEQQVDIAFGGDAYRTKDISLSEMRFRRFMAIACGRINGCDGDRGYLQFHALHRNGRDN